MLKEQAILTGKLRLLMNVICVTTQKKYMNIMCYSIIQVYYV